MVVTIRSLGISGITGYGVSVECALSGGLPAFDVVGLPDAAVRDDHHARQHGVSFFTFGTQVDPVVPTALLAEKMCIRDRN